MALPAIAPPEDRTFGQGKTAQIPASASQAGLICSGVSRCVPIFSSASLPSLSQRTSSGKSPSGVLQPPGRTSTPLAAEPHVHRQGGHLLIGDSVGGTARHPRHRDVVAFGLGRCSAWSYEWQTPVAKVANQHLGCPARGEFVRLRRQHVGVVDDAHHNISGDR
jgi:hypothetical protein